jgi:glutamine amidotransferase
MKVTVFDYGSGNIHSLIKALAAPNLSVGIECDPEAALATDLLVLPGVGAFPAAAARLASGREAMRDALSAGLPCIGICLGMQLLFETSEEGPGAGLGVIAGRVERLEARRVPHIGWSTVEEACDPALAVAPLPLAYFAHGFVCRPASPAVATAWTRYQNDRFPAVVRSGATVGVQFHPEKSSRDGVRLLAALVAEAARAGVPPVAAVTPGRDREDG